ncbi:hypothetical protein RQP46_010085 [Phenoliferia psychrophenolica]
MNHIQGAWNTLSGSETAQAASAMVEDDSTAFKGLGLTKTQRLYGFGICLVAGFALSLIGAIFFTFGQIALFATLYTLGVVISLVGTGFLIGFTRQLKMAWDPVRRYAAGVFLLCIALVFVFAFAVEIDVLVIVFAVLTFLSYAWYSLSFIPYARDLMIKLSPF